jgi:hypothetical protein
MGRRYTYATTLSFGSDGEPGYSEVDVEVSYQVYFGRPAQTYGPAENCYPAEADEVDDVRLEKVEGKPRPWDMGFGFLSDDAFAEMVVEQLERSDEHHRAMAAEAAEDEAAARDDYLESLADERRMEARHG